MLSIHSKHFNPPGSMVYYQASPEGKFAWFLCTWHPEKDFVLEEIQAEIKLELINAEPLKLSRMEVENWLKAFWSEYHWKLHAGMRKTVLQEKGISLFFGILYDSELFFVQFGRMLCGIVDDKGLSQIGRSWKHYHIKAAHELELLGYAEEDIKVRPQRLRLDEDQHFLVLPSPQALKLIDQLKDTGTLQALLESCQTEKNALWLQLSRLSDLSLKKKRKLSRLQISSIVLLVITLLAALYVAFGNRFIDQGLHKLRLLFDSRRVSTLEELPNTLRLRNSDILKIMERMVNSPARRAECRIAWTKQLPYEVTAIPAFDLDYIYLASGKNLLTYSKRTQEAGWNLVLDEDILYLMKTQNTLLLSLRNRRLIGIKPGGTIAWAIDTRSSISEDDVLEAQEITSAQDPRIDGSLVILPERNRISIIDGSKGEVFSSIDLLQDLRYLSLYDSFDSCFYAVIGNSLMKIDLVILN
jgi:hypothetical protein